MKPPFPKKKYIEIIEIKEEIEHKIESMRGNKSNTINGKILISSNCKLTIELKNERRQINPIR